MQRLLIKLYMSLESNIEFIQLLLPKLKKYMHTCTMYVIYQAMDAGLCRFWPHSGFKLFKGARAQKIRLTSTYLNRNDLPLLQN